MGTRIRKVLEGVGSFVVEVKRTTSPGFGDSIGSENKIRVWNVD